MSLLTLIACALLAQDPCPSDLEPAPAAPGVAETLATYAAWVVSPPGAGIAWLEVTDGGEGTYFVTIEGEVGGEAVICWHLDPAVILPRSALRPGARVRYTGPNCGRAYRVEVVCLGPLAFETAQEEWIAEAAGGRLEKGLTGSEIATVEALGSPSYLVRESVTRALQERGPRALRVLVWGRRHRDPEVRGRAGSLLAALGWAP